MKKKENNPEVGKYGEEINILVFVMKIFLIHFLFEYYSHVK